LFRGLCLFGCNVVPSRFATICERLLGCGLQTSAHDSQSLSIISVVFPDASLLKRNLELTKRLNSPFAGRWIIVDNTPASDLSITDDSVVEVLPGVAPPESRDRGSLHHALALEKALRQVQTRFVLLLDLDFYVVREDWTSTVLAHVREREIGIFGAVWNPRWFYQYRGFSSVHFMLIDLDRIPLTDIDLKPSIDNDLWWGVINDDSLPWPRLLRETLKAGRCRDTGWRFYRRYHHHLGVNVETLVPHYGSPASGRYRWESRLAAMLPHSWRKYPPDPRTFTRTSFLQQSWPGAYEQGWEEFFWQGSPFAIHLRRVGRSMTDASLDEDHSLLADFLARMPEIQKR